MASDPKDARTDRGDAEEAPVEKVLKTPIPEPVVTLKRTVSSTQLLASEVLAQLRQKSGIPPKLEEEDEEEGKKSG
jgi:hypothetical protein